MKWTLILFSIFAGDGATTVVIDGYASEQECQHAARHYEAQAGTSIHYARTDRSKVWLAIGECREGR